MVFLRYGGDCPNCEAEWELSVDREDLPHGVITPNDYKWLESDDVEEHPALPETRPPFEFDDDIPF